MVVRVFHIVCSLNQLSTINQVLSLCFPSNCYVQIHIIIIYFTVAVLATWQTSSLSPVSETLHTTTRMCISTIPPSLWLEPYSAEYIHSGEISALLALYYPTSLWANKHRQRSESSSDILTHICLLLLYSTTTTHLGEFPFSYHPTSFRANRQRNEFRHPPIVGSRIFVSTMHFQQPTPVFQVTTVHIPYHIC